MFEKVQLKAALDACKIKKNMNKVPCGEPFQQGKCVVPYGQPQML